MAGKKKKTEEQSAFDLHLQQEKAALQADIDSLREILDSNELIREGAKENETTVAEYTAALYQEHKYKSYYLYALKEGLDSLEEIASAGYPMDDDESLVIRAKTMFCEWVEDQLMKDANWWKKSPGNDRKCSKAVDLRHELAWNGDPESAYRYANAMRDGFFTYCDWKIAAKYYRIAADAGNAEAMYYYGLFRYLGLDCAKDLQEAEKYLSAAAGHDHPKANYFLYLISAEKGSSSAEYYHKRAESLGFTDADYEDYMYRIRVSMDEYGKQEGNYKAFREPEIYYGSRF